MKVHDTTMVLLVIFARNVTFIERDSSLSSVFINEIIFFDFENLKNFNKIKELHCF